MNREEFLGFYNQMQAEAKDLVAAKNSDYSTSEDALSNFRLSEVVGGDAGLGILYRMTDKLARAWALHSHDPSVKSETTKDTLLDLTNYAIIYLAWLEDKNNVFEDNDDGYHYTGPPIDPHPPIKWGKGTLRFSGFTTGTKPDES